MTTEELPFRWRSVAVSALLPTLLFSIGEGAIIPIIPLAADNLGASLAIAGLISAMLTLGQLVGDIPSGWLVSRIGERTAMIGAALLSVVGLVSCLVAPHPVVLGVGVALIGLSAAVFALARHALMTSIVPARYRARALSTLGGTFRLGFFIGPFLSAAVIHLSGSAQSAFVIHIVACVLTAGVLLALPDPAARLGPTGSREGERLVAEEAHGLFRTIARNRGVLLRLGAGGASVAALRASRQVILPLWAVSIGLPEATTAIVIGIAGAVDFALFYLGGHVMDRYGRLWTAVPSMLGLGLGHILLGVSAWLPSPEVWFVVVAMLLAVANGIGSGILMTLGADLADKRDPAPFLGAWRFTGDSGAAAVPLLISAVTAVASLAIASGVVGAIGLLGAGALARYVPRYSPHRR